MSSVLSIPDRKQPYPAQIQSGKVESSTLPSQKGYNRELLKLKAHWITDIFPDELVVQEKTISIIRNQFLVSFIETMPVRDIGRVVYIDTPFFAGIQIIGKNTAHQLQIKGLNKRLAMDARELIEGLLLEEAGTIDMPDWIGSKDHGAALQRAGKDMLNGLLIQNKHYRHE